MASGFNSLSNLANGVRGSSARSPTTPAMLRTPTTRPPEFRRKSATLRARTTSSAVGSMTMALFPKIQSPCPYKSNLSAVMDGDFCRECKRHVTDLTAMADGERVAFLDACVEEKVCVTYRLPAFAAAAVMGATLAAASSAAAATDLVTEVVITGGRPSGAGPIPAACRSGGAGDRPDVRTSRRLRRQAGEPGGAGQACGRRNADQTGGRGEAGELIGSTLDGPLSEDPEPLSLQGEPVRGDGRRLLPHVQTRGHRPDGHERRRTRGLPRRLHRRGLRLVSHSWCWRPLPPLRSARDWPWRSWRWRTT